MTKGRYGGQEKRRSPRYDRKFIVRMEYDGKTHEIRTIDISEHGVMIPRRLPPPVGTHVKLTLTLRDEIPHLKVLSKGIQNVRLTG